MPATQALNMTLIYLCLLDFLLPQTVLEVESVFPHETYCECLLLIHETAEYLFSHASSLFSQSTNPSVHPFIRLSVHQSSNMQQKQLPCCSSHSCVCVSVSVSVCVVRVCLYVCVVRVFVPIISCSCLLIKCVKRRHLISFSYLQRSDMAYT